MSDPSQFRAQAEGLGAGLPPLLAQAQVLAASLTLGEHRRRQAGTGDEFWQYRPALAGDSARLIDWRRSARSDGHYIREKEWQIAQSVWLWCDDAASMQFSGAPGRATKAHYAKVLALALAILMLKGGERVGLLGQTQARSGKAQVNQLVMALMAEENSPADYSPAPQFDGQSRGAAVFLSDFLGPIEDFEQRFQQAADLGLRGVILQVLDPLEEEFPFSGRVVFESGRQNLRYETQEASDLRSRYLDRLAQRKDRLRGLAQSLGWRYGSYHSASSASAALLWLYRALEDGF